MIERNVTVETQPTPHEIALEFCLMDADDQALVFEYITQISDAWGNPFSVQVYEITKAIHFGADASRFMKTLGDYA